MDSPAFLERQGKPSHVLAAGFAITAFLGVIDFLTGAVNSRFFHDLARMEIERSRRYARPFPLAYIDLDNFKAVNDPFGHSAGDRVSPCRGEFREEVSAEYGRVGVTRGR